MDRLQGPRFSPAELVEMQRSMGHERRQLAIDASSYNLRALLEFIVKGTEMSDEDQAGIGEASLAIHRIGTSLSAEAKIAAEIRRQVVYGE